MQNIDPHRPVWQDFRARLAGFDKDQFPAPDSIDNQLANGLRTTTGKPVRFINNTNIGVATIYEQHIYQTGEVATRENNFHDLFNALIWWRFPLLKAALNAAHYTDISAAPRGNRSKRRDALTLFDECGVIIVSANAERLQQLARHEWRSVFYEHADEWGTVHNVFVAGHALLEKYLNPYKAITGQALLLKSTETVNMDNREAKIAALDRWLADAIGTDQLLASTDNLSAVPLAGMPGWSMPDKQHADFYADTDVFRPLGSNRPIAPVHTVKPATLRIPAD